MKRLVVSSACLILAGMASSASAVCYDVQVEGIPIELCADEDSASASVAGIEVEGRIVSNPPAWEIAFPILEFGPIQLVSGRFQINSGGPYADELIAEICTNNPVAVTFRNSGIDFGKKDCSSWIRLGSFPYYGP